MQLHCNAAQAACSDSVAILRPDVLDEVERFIHVNQPATALSARRG
jgi:hypothetical protein